MENLVKCCPDLLAILIQKDMPSAKAFILQKRVGLEVQRILSQLDTYTLEGISVYVLCSLFNAGS